MGFIEGARQRLAGAADQSGGGYGPVVSAGTPVTGTFGAAVLEKGALVIDTTNGKLFTNTGSKAVPTWTVVGSQS